MRTAILVAILAVGVGAAVPVARAQSVPIGEIKLVAEESSPPTQGITATADAGYYSYFTYSTYTTVSSGHGGRNSRGSTRGAKGPQRDARGAPLVEVDLR
jgi:hypothetical protein